MTTETRLMCCRCLHKSTDEDRVMLYRVGGKGDEARCVDDNSCLERQIENLRKAKLSKPLTGIVR